MICVPRSVRFVKFGKPAKCCTPASVIAAVVRHGVVRHRVAAAHDPAQLGEHPVVFERPVEPGVAPQRSDLAARIEQLREDLAVIPVDVPSASVWDSDRTTSLPQ